jgi:hypothetical protein
MIMHSELLECTKDLRETQFSTLRVEEGLKLYYRESLVSIILGLPVGVTKWVTRSMTASLH